MAFTAQGIYTFACTQPGTNSLEVPWLVAPERVQPSAYTWPSRSPAMNAVLFLNLASLKSPLGQCSLLFILPVVKGCA